MAEEQARKAWAEADSLYSSGRFADAIQGYQSALEFFWEDSHSQDWAALQNNLGVAYSDLPTGDKGENLAKAIACYEAALRIRTEKDFPSQWAMTQNNLGIAHRNMPTGDKGENLAKAIACYEAALRIHTEKDFPSDWAMTQNNLGVAYRNLPTGDKGDNLAKAIACYEASLRIRTEKDSPANWAMTQNNLGIAYSDLPKGDREENLAKAITCYEAALRIYTEKDFPADWAMTQNNLGEAYRNLPTGDRGENLAKGIACYEAALRIFIEKDFPYEWAGTQNNLGIAYSDLPTGNKGENLAKAIACFEAALRIRTEKDSPAAWAMTQNNLGNAYADLPTGDKGENLAKAIACYEAALRIRTEKDFPSQWAMTRNNLGIAYRNLPTGDKGENLAKAIACYEAALRIFTEKDFPSYWATTQNNLGTAYSDLPTGDKGDNLGKAITCYEAALRIYTEKDFPADWAMTQNNLGIAYSDLPTGDRGENLAKAIACYEAALRIYTEKDFPADWAMTQNNLAALLGSPAAPLPKGVPDPWELAAAVALTPHVRSVYPDHVTKSLALIARLARRRRSRKEGIRLLRKAADYYRERDLPYLAEYATSLAAGLETTVRRRPPATDHDRIFRAYATDSRLSALASYMERAKKERDRITQLLEKERTVATTDDGALWVLQKWNSFTPLLTAAGRDDSRGGGYFLTWRGKGIVIDPGLDFLRNFREAGRSVLDIDLVILTHNHLDHVGDVIPILTLLHEYNERYPNSPHRLAMACSPSTFSMFADLAVHSAWIEPFVPLRPEIPIKALDIPLAISAFRTTHAELGGRRSAIGLRINLECADSSTCCVVMPGDGGWTESLCAHCVEADLLVLHLGGLYPADVGPSDFETNHLGPKGVFALLWQLEQRNALPKMTLISELGEELRGTEGFVARTCCEGLSVSYRTSLIESILRRAIVLPALKVMCEQALEDTNARCTNPAEPQEWEERPGELKHAYLCDTHWAAKHVR